MESRLSTKVTMLTICCVPVQLTPILQPSVHARWVASGSRL